MSVQQPAQQPIQQPAQQPAQHPPRLQYDYLQKIEQFGRNIEKGDLKISQRVKYGIVLYGDTKTGKTSTSLLLSGVILSVVRQYGQYFLNTTQQNIYPQAKIGMNENSQTSIPNFFKVKLKNKQKKEFEGLLIDTPGYGDSDGMIKIIANGYYHYKLYSRIENMKFIICVDRADLNGTANNFIQTILEFTSSFKQYLKQKNTIWKSCAMIITKVEQTPDTLNDLCEKIKRIADNVKIQLEKADQQAMRQMIRFLVENGRIFYIKKYKDKQTPHCPQLLNQINQKVSEWWNRKIDNQKGIVDMKPIKFSLTGKINSLASKQPTTKKQLVQLITFYNQRVKNFRDKIPQKGTIKQVLQQIMADAMKQPNSHNFIKLMQTYVKDQYKFFDPSLESERKQVQKQLFSLDNQRNQLKGKIESNDFHYTIKKFDFIVKSHQIMAAEGAKNYTENSEEALLSYKNALCNIFRLFNSVSCLYQNRQSIIYKYCYVYYRIVEECKVFYHLIEESSTPQQKKMLQTFSKEFIQIFAPLKQLMNWDPQYQGSKPLEIKQAFLRKYNPDENTIQNLKVDEPVIEFFTDPQQDQKCKDCNQLKLTISKLLLRYSIQVLSTQVIQDRKIFGKLIVRLSKFRKNCELVYSGGLDNQKKQALILIRKMTIQLAKMLQKLNKHEETISVYKTINSISQVSRLYEKLILDADKKINKNKYPQNSVTLRLEYASFLQEHLLQQKAIMIVQDAYDKSETIQNVEKTYQLINDHYNAIKTNNLPEKKYQNQLTNKVFFNSFDQNLYNRLETYANLQ